MYFGRKSLLILLVGFLLQQTVSLSASSVDYGLLFRSHNVDQDSRTSLHLSPDSHFRLKNGFTLSFDMKLYELDANYGYVFRIIADGNSALDMVCNLYEDRFRFILSNNHDVAEKVRVNGPGDFAANGWCHIEVSISRNGEILCSVGGKSYALTRRFPSLKDIDIWFGWSDHPVYYTTDVAPMSLKNVRISSISGEVEYEWPLFMHNEDEVYDNQKHRLAVVKDGVWIADSHFNWESLMSVKTSTGIPMLAYDAPASRLFVATADSVHIWSLETGEMSSEKVVSGTPVRNSGNQMIYDAGSDELICYSMHNRSLAKYDFASREWRGSFREEWPPMTGQSHIYDTDSSRLYVFGGYGNHMYKADLTVFDLNGGQRVVNDMSESIWPRYFSAMGLDEDGNIIIMGGFGNQSGYQEESPGDLVDVVKIDRETLSCTNMGSFVPGDEPVAFGSSLLSDKDRIYALVFNNTKFNTSLWLAEYSEDASPLTLYADPIEYKFRDTDSWASLVFNSDSTRMYSIVLSSIGRGMNEVSVYSLAYPPILASEVLQSRPVNIPYYIIGIVLFCVLALVAVAFVLIYRRKRGIWHIIMDDSSTVFDISLLGGFRIIDKAGNDLTSRLTSVPRQILMYLLLRKMGSKSAVTSAELENKFWSGMDRAQVINNRNVNIRKLRIVLNELGDIQIVYKNDTWTIDIGDSLLCDYFLFLPLLRRAADSDHISLSDISMIFSYAKGGSLLSGYEYEWLDKYKAAYSELLIKVMMKIVRHPMVASEPELVIKVVDFILSEDCIDEFAVRTKCRQLYDMGQKGKSKQIYDQYVLDYRRLLDSEPEISYQSMLEQSIIKK